MFWRDLHGKRSSFSRYYLQRAIGLSLIRDDDTSPVGYFIFILSSCDSIIVGLSIFAHKPWANGLKSSIPTFLISLFGEGFIAILTILSMDKVESEGGLAIVYISLCLYISGISILSKGGMLAFDIYKMKIRSTQSKAKTQSKGKENVSSLPLFPSSQGNSKESDSISSLPSNDFDENETVELQNVSIEAPAGSEEKI